ncbi:MAG: LytR/AlgR family response regulator transcription factor [Bacillota bacterium]
MKVLIVEDEVLTSRRLSQMILSYDSTIEILGVLDSIESVVNWFQKNNEPDLIFMDIQLSDGLCFEIFNKTSIEAPIIFTTAFDEYAIQAFRVNSIDYLLKPVKKEELIKSLEKYDRFKSRFSGVFKTSEIYEVLKSMSVSQQIYKSRFLVKSGQAFIKINSESVAYFYSENKLTYLVLFNGKKYLSDHTLEVLEGQLDPAMFFRVSRQHIVNVNSIEGIHIYFGGSLKLQLTPKADADVIVSRRRVISFKEWMNK